MKMHHCHNDWKPPCLDCVVQETVNDYIIHDLSNTIAYQSLGENKDMRMDASTRLRTEHDKIVLA